MSATEAVTTSTPPQPVDAVVERLNDPAVAAALVSLLDNVELLSTLVHGLSSFVERGDTIMDSLATGLTELRTANAESPRKVELPSLDQLSDLAGALTRATPLITDVLDSHMVSPETVDVLSLVSEAAVEGAANARKQGSTVGGLRAALRILKDPEVGRGLGLLVEIAKSLGRRLR